MFGIAFDNKGNGIVTENGEALYDEINLLKPGGNYGFPMLQPMGKAPELNSSSIPPIRSYKSTIAPTQAIYYPGKSFHCSRINLFTVLITALSFMLLN